MNTPDTYVDLFFGYTVIWLILGIYILTLGVRLKKLEKREGESGES